MNNPDDRKYTKEHEWVKVNGDIATMGITEHAQELLTDIVFVELPEKSKKAEQSKNLCVVESVKSVSDVFAPVSGEVVEVNAALKEMPELVNKSPFEQGWIAKIKIKDAKELDSLMSAAQYTDFISKEQH